MKQDLTSNMEMLVVEDLIPIKSDAWVRIPKPFVQMKNSQTLDKGVHVFKFLIPVLRALGVNYNNMHRVGFTTLSIISELIGC